MGFALAMSSWQGLAQNNKVLKAEAESKDRATVKGHFAVSEIKKLKNEVYLIVFKGLGAKPANEVHLETYHVHISLKKGQELEITANIFPEYIGRKVMKAHQILLFLNRPEGRVPVWLLSKDSNKLEIKSTLYLKMAHPDFQVF